MNRMIAACAATLLLASAGPAAAQDYPTDNVTMIVPFSPGGGNDAVGRLAAQYLPEFLGQAVVVENRDGAAGAVGLQALKQSEADGYTIATTSDGPLIINPAIYDNLPYDVDTDFVPVALMTRNPVVLVVNPEVEARTVEELLALAKENPGKVSYSTGGIGNYGHLAGELLESTTGAEFLHVPYKGTGPAVVAALSGEVDFMFSGVNTVMEHIKAGALIPIGVGETERVEALSDVPTIAETVPGFESGTWIGIIAPAGTPEDRVNKLATAINEVFKKPEVIEIATQQGLTATPLMPEEFGALIQRETEKWHPIIEEAGIKATP